MTQKKKIIFVLMVLVVVLCGCSENNSQVFDREEAFASMVNLSHDNNQSIELVTFKNYEEVNFDSVSTVGLKINSQNPIWFTNNYGLRFFLFSEQGNEWIEVYDDVIYSSPEPFVRKHKEKFAIECSIEFWPDIPPDTKASELRIYVEGKIMRDGQPTEEIVSSFIDMPISR